MSFRRPETVFAAILAAGIVTVLFLAISGLSIVWLARIWMILFAFACVPLLGAILFVAIPEWWRSQFGSRD
jgi:hypothetical protein